MLGALVWSILTGDWDVFFLATVWEHHHTAGLGLVLAVLVSAALRGWLIWTLLVWPRFEGPLWMRALRWLIFVNAVLFLLGPEAEDVGFFLMLPVLVLLPMVFHQVPVAVRMAVAAAGVTASFVPGAEIVWPIGVVLLQSFGRWNPITSGLGMAALVHVGLANSLPTELSAANDPRVLWLLLDGFAVLTALWLAHTATDLGRDPATTPATPIAARVTAAVVSALVIGTVAGVSLPPQEVVGVVAVEPEPVDDPPLTDREVEYALERNCRDPWPHHRVRGQVSFPVFLQDPASGYRIETHLPGDPPGYLERVPVTVGAGVRAVCMTAKTFASAPPVRAEGWRSVVEVPVRSPDGGLLTRGTYPLFFHDSPKGHQRVRLYARDLTTPGLKAEHHMIVIFPGRSTKEVVHK
ncbi:hypothetical protein [Herbidospora sp. RD11066]